MILLAALGTASPSTLAQKPSQTEEASGSRTVKEAGVTFVYDLADFGRMTVSKERKWTAQDNGDGVPVGITPAHNCFVLEDKRPLPALEQGGRYFFPTQSFVCVIPLADPSVKNFGRAYPDLDAAARALRGILRKRPKNFGRGGALPDMPYIEARQSFRSKLQYLDFRSVSGLAFVTQYGQDMTPSPANNEELTFNFQGLTRDGRYYVAARFAITHPSLPKGIDFTDDSNLDKGLRYLKRDEKMLDKLPEASFRPSLKSLKALLASITVE
jgi:hypothetical protein